MKEDFNWFIDNYDQLFNEYGHKFLVIKDQKVLGSYNSPVEAINETSKTEQRGTFIVQECNGNESGYTNYIASWAIA